MRVMSESARLFYVVMCTVGGTACSYPRLPEFMSDAASSDAAPLPQFLSCAGLAKTCGANGNDDCCSSLAAPGGSYDRSYDLAGNGDTNSPATVSNFRLDKYEVTVGGFERS